MDIREITQQKCNEILAPIEQQVNEIQSKIDEFVKNNKHSDKLTEGIRINFGKEIYDLSCKYLGVMYAYTDKDNVKDIKFIDDECEKRLDDLLNPLREYIKP